jgi:serine/threonine-protein kinase
MGVVVVAKHIALGELVAVKLLLPEHGAKAAGYARFVREARAASRIRSEHVVRVFDLGVLEDGFPYMAMELLSGTDLASLLAKGRLPVTDAVDYVLQACEGIAEAHVRGIVHRDLKPANLFLTRRSDGTACVKVLDFGISKVDVSPVTPISPRATTDGGEARDAGVVGLERTETSNDSSSVPGEAIDAAALTRSRGHLGTPLYMSPEQMRSARDVDARTDIWSLGTILYELLSGSRAFDAPSYERLLERVANEDPPAPDSLRARVPAALGAVVLRCLRKAPSDRFPSVGELAEALAPFASAQVAPTAARTVAILAKPAPSDGDHDDGIALAPTVDGTGPPARSAPATERRRTFRTFGALGAVALVGLAAFGVSRRGLEARAGAPAEPPASPLAAPGTKLACPVLESRGVGEPGAWFGAAAADIV